MLRLSLVILLAAVSLGACMEHASVRCDDGSVCAAGRVCDTIHKACVSPSQATACQNLAQGDLCSADGRDARCDQGVCLPDCGDGVLDAEEQCDDANYVSHDGCSSACLLETLAWERWENPWRPRSGHVSAFDSARGRLVMFGGTSDGAQLGDTWERIESADGARWVPIATATAPSARRGAAMAYDPVRGVVVLFGGRDAGLLNDTWEYDGVDWSRRTLPASPSARRNTMMEFDPSRQAIVLFGGVGEASLLGDLWEYDGTWTPGMAGPGPSERADAAMAYDPARGRMVLFGGAGVGFLDDTWELAATWAQGPSGPGARSGAAMAYASGQGGQAGSGLVMFGGSGVDGLWTDVWRYNGAWTPLAMDSQPPGVTAARLTTVVRGSMSIPVLIAGRTELGPTDAVYQYDGDRRWQPDTAVGQPVSTGPEAVLDASGRMTLLAEDGALWHFDGVGWTTTETSTTPGGRQFHATAFDASRNSLVIYGGVGNAILGDTWVFDGSSFQDVTMASDPPRRTGMSVAYDAKRAVTVIVGGDDGVTILDETWERDTAWYEAARAPMGPQQVAPMAYDPIREYSVLLANNGETWTYNGTWLKLDVETLIDSRRGGAMAFDPWRRRMVIVGGQGALGALDSALELTDNGWQELLVQGETPGERTNSTLRALPAVHALVLYGGTSMSDTWYLRSRSETPDELCNDTNDNDMDGRTDADDPDCTLP